MNPRRIRVIIIGVLILAVISTACAGLRPRRAVGTPTPSPEQLTSQVDPMGDLLPLQTATPVSDSPTDRNGEGSLVSPGDQTNQLPLARLLSAQRPYKFGIILGLEDPFFASVLRGAQQAATNQEIELLVQVPQTWNSQEQVQKLEVLLARGDLDAILVSPVDSDAVIPILQKPSEAGIPIITMQTNLGDETIVKPLLSFTTDNYVGGHMACQALVEMILTADNANGSISTEDHLIYIQQGISEYQDLDARARGCIDYLSQVTGFRLAGSDSHGGDDQVSSQLITAQLAQEPGLRAIVCMDILCARSASQALVSKGLTGQVKIVAFEATPETVSLFKAGMVDILATPKPSDMGYLSVVMAAASLDRVSSLPPSLQVGWKIFTSLNLEDSTSARWYYETNTSTVLGSKAQSSTRGLKIGFIAGITDPFYKLMARGARQAIESQGAELLSFYPQNWSPEEQFTILQNLGAGGDLNVLLLVPTDPIVLVPAVQEMQTSGVPIIILDTSIDPNLTPLTSITSDMQAGGYFTCRSLAQAIAGKGKVYIQNVTPGISSTDARERGCTLALQEFSEITLVAVNYNDDDPAKVQAQLSTVLENYPDLAAVFCTNGLSAQAVGQQLASLGLSGRVKVAAFDATASTQNYLREGLIDMVTAQKPSDMGYLGALIGIATLDGVTAFPAQLTTGYVLLTRENMDDPYYKQFFYIDDLP